MPAVRDETARVEVERADTAGGPRLRIRDAGSGHEIFLDPIELEGLTRLRESRDQSLRALARGPADTPSEAAADLEILQNEFAMVQVGRVELEDGPALYIRDLASRAETTLRMAELAGLAKLRHRQLAPLLDPSDLVASAEPDPDQV
jgi:hypothetical protein